MTEFAKLIPKLDDSDKDKKSNGKKKICCRT